jgi:hypothetical protein
LTCSIIGSHEIVAGVESVSLSGHPVTEEQSGEEGDERGVDIADAEKHRVEIPADDPEVREKSLNLLYT